MKYQRVIEYVLERPWAIRKSALIAILDVLAYRAEGGEFTAEELSDRLGKSDPAPQAARTTSARTGGSVAIIPLYGSIFPRANLFTEFSGGTSLERFSAVLEEVANESHVTSIVLDVASPGGMVDLVPETGEQIRQIDKPVTAVANAEAASAAYWIAAQADELVVTPSGMVGSIGVWMAHEDWSKHDANLGVDTTLIYAGKKKVDGNPFEPLSDRARADMQAIVDTYYDKFVDAVAQGRKASTTAVRDGFGEGGMVTAENSVTEGMADRVASLDQVVAEHITGRLPEGRRASGGTLPQGYELVLPAGTSVLPTTDGTGITITEPASDPEPVAVAAEDDEEVSFYEALLEHL